MGGVGRGGGSAGRRRRAAGTLSHCGRPGAFRVLEHGGRGGLRRARLAADPHRGLGSCAACPVQPRPTPRPSPIRLTREVRPVRLEEGDARGERHAVSRPLVVKGIQRVQPGSQQRTEQSACREKRLSRAGLGCPEPRTRRGARRRGPASPLPSSADSRPSEACLARSVGPCKQKEQRPVHMPMYGTQSRMVACSMMTARKRTRYRVSDSMARLVDRWACRRRAGVMEGQGRGGNRGLGMSTHGQRATPSVTACHQIATPGRRARPPASPRAPAPSSHRHLP